jgi:hypothetical protein
MHIINKENSIFGDKSCSNIYIIIKNERKLYTVGFYGGKSHENHLFRLYFLKI